MTDDTSIEPLVHERTPFSLPRSHFLKFLCVFSLNRSDGVQEDRQVLDRGELLRRISVTNPTELEPSFSPLYSSSDVYLHREDGVLKLAVMMIDMSMNRRSRGPWYWMYYILIEVYTWN